MEAAPASFASSFFWLGVVPLYALSPLLLLSVQFSSYWAIVLSSSSAKEETNV